MIDWEGQTVLDRDGEKIGKIEDIFLVEDTGRPEWALVKVGRLKARTTLVPLMRANRVKDGVAVDVTKDLVSEAPEVLADNEPSEHQANALYRHYGIPIPAAPAVARTAAANGSPAAPPAAVGGSPDLRDQPIGDLLKTVKEEGSTLASQELRLAKAEMSGKAKDVGIGAGMFGGAGYVANLAALALMLTIISRSPSSWLRGLRR